MSINYNKSKHFSLYYMRNDKQLKRFFREINGIVEKSYHILR